MYNEQNGALPTFRRGPYGFTTGLRRNAKATPPHPREALNGRKAIAFQEKNIKQKPAEISAPEEP